MNSKNLRSCLKATLAVFSFVGLASYSIANPQSSIEDLQRQYNPQALQAQQQPLLGQSNPYGNAPTGVYLGGGQSLNYQQYMTPQGRAATAQLQDQVRSSSVNGYIEDPDLRIRAMGISALNILGGLNEGLGFFGLPALDVPEDFISNAQSVLEFYDTAITYYEGIKALDKAVQSFQAQETFSGQNKAFSNILKASYGIPGLELSGKTDALKTVSNIGSIYKSFQTIEKNWENISETPDGDWKKIARGDKIKNRVLLKRAQSIGRSLKRLKSPMTQVGKVSASSYDTALTKLNNITSVKDGIELEPGASDLILEDSPIMVASFGRTTFHDPRTNISPINPDDPTDNRGYHGFPYEFEAGMNQEMFLDYRDKWLQARNRFELKEFASKYQNWTTHLFGNDALPPTIFMPEGGATSAALIPDSAVAALFGQKSASMVNQSFLIGNMPSSPSAINAFEVKTSSGGNTCPQGLDPTLANNPFNVEGTALENGGVNFVGPLPQYRPSSADGSVGILRQLIGDPGNLGLVPGGQAKEKLQDMFMVLNTAIAAIAALYFTWVVLSSLLHGAHDGEFLGKRYHSYWAPIKVAVGAGLIIPIPVIGFNLAQLLTILATTTGIGIANTVAEPSIALLNGTAPAARPALTTIKAADFMPETLKGATCISTFARNVQVENGAYLQPDQIVDGLDQQYAEYFKVRFEAKLSNIGSTLVKVDFVADTSQISDPAIKARYENSVCDSFQYGYAPSEASRASGVEKSNEEYMNRQVNLLNQAGMKMSIDAIQLIVNFRAHEIITSENSDSGDKKELITKESLSSGTFSNLRTFEDFISFGNSKGWEKYRFTEAGSKEFLRIFAVSFDKKLDRVANQASSNIACATQSDMRQMPARYGWIGTGLHSLSSFQVIGQTAVKQQTPQKKVSSCSSSDSSSLWDIITTKFSSLACGIAESFTELKDKMVGFVDGYFLNDIRAAAAKVFGKASFGSMQEIASFGSALIKAAVEVTNLVIGLFIGLVGASTALMIGTIGTAVFKHAILYEPALGFISMGLAFLGALVGLVVVPLVAFGFKLAIVIPMIPVIFWVGVILDWIVIVVEALIAAPYWAMAHLEAEGEGMGQRTSHGYIFFLNLLFRPAICVLVFSMLYLILGILLGFVNGILDKGLSFIQTSVVDAGFFGLGGSFIVGIILALGGIAYAATIFETILNKVFSMLSIVPDKVFTWIGGNFGSNVSGGMAESAGQGGASAAAQAMNTGGGAALNKALSSGAGVAGTGADAIRAGHQEKLSQARGDSINAASGGSDTEQRAARSKVAGLEKMGSAKAQRSFGGEAKQRYMSGLKDTMDQRKERETKDQARKDSWD